jgi:2-isopropylmalate synthase
MTDHHRSILVVDQTLREGMQFQGMVFSGDQRRQILCFQESLGVDICQAGYPPAHASEVRRVKDLADLAAQRGYSIRVAAMGRAWPGDAATLSASGVRDFHLHAHIPVGASPQDEDRVFRDIAGTLDELRSRRPDPVVSLAMLDIGRTPPARLREQSSRAIHELRVDILSLPDTSGMMAPNRIAPLLRPVVRDAAASSTLISVHCHNDLGMASANTVMGITAGAGVMEATALGIGERNGLADLYTTARTLKEQGYAMNLRTDDIEGFRAYYTYVNGIVRQQTGLDLMTYTTPFFGGGVRAHVAGTHGSTAFGIAGGDTVYLNLLCGRTLVGKYLEAASIPVDPGRLGAVTEAIKSRSAELGRRLTREEIAALALNRPSCQGASIPEPGATE